MTYNGPTKAHHVNLMRQYLVSDCTYLKHCDGAMAFIIHTEDPNINKNTLDDEEYWDNSTEGLKEDDAYLSNYILDQPVPELPERLI